VAKKDRLRDTAVKIGTAAGRMDRKAHQAAQKAAKAAEVARGELRLLSKQVEALKNQLNKSAKRVQSALK